MNTSLVKYLLEAIQQAPTVANLEQRRALAEDLAAKYERENAGLRAIVARQEGELNSRPAPEFAEHRGVLWKRLPNGGFASDAYCPKCRVAMSAFVGPAICSRCNLEAPFDFGEMRAVHAAIPLDA